MITRRVNAIDRIVVMNLDSLCSGTGLHRFFEHFKGRIVGIIASRRYGGKYGGFWKQTWKNYSRSGYDFVDYLGFSNFWHIPTVYITDLINNFRGKTKNVYLLSQLAKKYSVPIIYTLEPNADAIVDQIAAMKPDLIVSTCFDHVIRTRLIGVPKFGVINVHTSLLPEFRGPFPGLWQALRDCTEVGVSVHYVNNEELDVGPIIKQKKTVRSHHESVLSLDCRLYRLGIECAVEAIQDIEQGIVRAVNQNPLEGGYYSYPSKTDLLKLKSHRVPLFRRKDFLAEFFE
jgi:folate-dependent phosphoribosylglycinamide formyltransferase PurN